MMIAQKRKREGQKEDDLLLALSTGFQTKVAWKTAQNDLPTKLKQSVKDFHAFPLVALKNYEVFDSVLFARSTNLRLNAIIYVCVCVYVLFGGMVKSKLDQMRKGFKGLHCYYFTIRINLETFLGFAWWSFCCVFSMKERLKRGRENPSNWIRFAI